MKWTHSLPLMTLALASPAWAQQFQDLNALDAQVAAALPGESVAAADRRLKLARCTEPLAIDAGMVGSVTVRCNALGWRIRLPIAGASATSVKEAAAEVLIHRGQQVELVFKGEGYELSTSGTAMEDGSAGKSIRVKTLTGNTPIHGTVVSSAIVHIAD